MERHAPDVENEEHTEEEFSSRSRCTAAGRGLDRLEMSFDGKMYTHGRQRQFLTVKKDYDINQDMDFTTPLHATLYLFK